MKHLKTVLVLITATLFAFSMLKTYELLGLSSSVNSEKEQDSESSKDKERNISNSYNENFFQLEDVGQTLFDGEYIYYNGNGYVLKYNIKNNTEEPIIAGKQMKCMVNANEYIYGVTTFPNGNSVDCDYIIKVSKTSGDSEIFYKTENKHITSMAFDGEYLYYTDESHAIYLLGDDISTWGKAKSTADYPLILGIYNKELFISDGTQIEAINIETKERRTAYGQVCSQNQMPIMSQKYVYMTSGFTKKDIIKVDLETGESETIVNKTFIKSIEKSINSFSISGNTIYINCGNTIYTKSLTKEGSPSRYKNIESEWSCSCNKNILYFINNGKIVVEEVKNVS